MLIESDEQIMTCAQRNTKAYLIPFHTLWLRSKDMVDLRMSGKTPQADRWTTTNLIAHIAAYRLIGVSVQDHKKLGIGRWLRTSGEEIAYKAGEPLPSDSVCYDEASRIAYFSIGPPLSDQTEAEAYTRPGKVYFLQNGSIARIRFPVTDRRGRAGVLGAAASLLAIR